MTEQQAPKEHSLKCWPSQFQAVWDGIKTHEWRRNDRDFQVGDHLELYEWDPDPMNDEPSYRDRTISAEITWITASFGVPAGWCCMSIKVLHREVDDE